MKILISGGSGMIGREITTQLLNQGHEVIVLTTQIKLADTQVSRAKYVYWNPSEGTIDISALQGTDAIINLAGYSVANKWTKENKEKMISSRLDSTRLLSSVALTLDKKPLVFVTASASGFYPDSDEWVDETSEGGSGFLSKLTAEWERASVVVEESGIRRVILRIGVVLDSHEGAMSKMLPIFRIGLGAAQGTGKQTMSWIHVQDLAKMFVYAIENTPLSGIYNASSPKPISNNEFCKALAKSIRRPYFLPRVPAVILKLLFGEMSTTILVSQKMHVSKIISSGFTFQFPTIESAFQNLFSSPQ